MKFRASVHPVGCRCNRVVGASTGLCKKGSGTGACVLQGFVTQWILMERSPASMWSKKYELRKCTN